MPFRPTYQTSLLLPALIMALSACGGSSSDNAGNGGGDNGGDQATLVIGADNAAAALVHARLAMEHLPRVQRNANIIISQGLNGSPTCDNTDGVFELTQDGDGAPQQALFENCVDPVYRSRTFDGRIDFDFSNPNLPYSRFVGYTNAVSLGADMGYQWAVEGGFTIRPEEDGNMFGIALIENADATVHYTVNAQGNSLLLGSRFEDFNVRFDSTVQFNDTPFSTLAANGRLYLSNELAQGWTRISTPHALTDPDSGGFCYANGEVVVEGANGTRAQLDYNGTDLMITVNGVTVVNGDCQALLEALLEEAGLGL